MFLHIEPPRQSHTDARTTLHIMLEDTLFIKLYIANRILTRIYYQKVKYPITENPWWAFVYFYRKLNLHFQKDYIHFLNGPATSPQLAEEKNFLILLKV